MKAAIRECESTRTLSIDVEKSDDVARAGWGKDRRDCCFDDFFRLEGSILVGCIMRKPPTHLGALIGAFVPIVQVV